MCLSENTVKLNVGGTVFETLKSTLTKHDGFFKTLIETEVPNKKVDSDCYFIDRSSKHFDTVLNYMRSGVAVLPESEELLQELRQEAHYYLLENLEFLCQPKKNKLKTYSTALELMQIIADADKPVVLINYLTHNEQLIHVPLGFNFSDFLKKNRDRFEIYIRGVDVNEPVRSDILRTRGIYDQKNEQRWSYHIYNDANSCCRDLMCLKGFQETIDSIID